MLEKKYAVITGGSKGLGFAFARYLALERGYDVILIARSKSDLDSAVTEIEQSGGKAYAFYGDVSDAAVIQTIAQRVREQFKEIDFLINNACALHVDELKNIKFEDVKKDIDIGFLGSIICTIFFSPLLKTGGRILFISSGFGLVGVAGYSIYSAIKAGIIKFAESIKREFHKRKINVYVAVPSDIDTPGFRNEIKNLPIWMNVSRARGEAAPADEIAQIILDKCNGTRFLIFSDCMVRLLYIINKMLPRCIYDKIINKIFPRPQIRLPI
jgi:NAD(P)-dependent dehydrogenase (short-subunit alcohol dehydrogenase family)